MEVNKLNEPEISQFKWNDKEEVSVRCPKCGAEMAWYFKGNTPTLINDTCFSCGYKVEK